jgi:hypothetical protein
VLAVYPAAQLDNDMSRFATVESLVDQGTWVIDDSIFLMKPARGKRPPTPIVDRVVYEGKSYSTKPPVMSFLMASVYWGLKNTFGLSFKEESQRSILVWLLTFGFVAIPFIGIALVYRKAIRWFVQDPLIWVVGLAILLCGNQLWGFSRTLNNHVPSAFFMFYGMVTALGLVHGKISPQPWRFLTIGLSLGLLPTFDLPGMFFCVPLFLYLLWWFPKQTLTWFMLGAIPPLLLHFILTWSVTGGLIPIYMKKELYHYKGSYWDKMGGFDALKEAKQVYFFHLSVGRKGLFSLFPVLLFAIWYLVCPYRSSLISSPEERSKGNMRRECLCLCLLTLFWMLFYTFQTNNYGGASFGFRWFMFFTPSLAFFAILGIHSFLSPVLSKAAPGISWRWGLVCLLVALSCYSGWQCSLDPWAANEELPTRILGKWTFP